MIDEDERAHPFRDSQQDAAAIRQVPDTPQTRAPAYRLAFTDNEFLLREELRPVRLQLELLKPQMIMDALGVRSTIVMFGGARIPAPDGAARPGATVGRIVDVPGARPRDRADVRLARLRAELLEGLGVESHAR